MKNIIYKKYILIFLVLFSIGWLGADFGNIPNVDDWLFMIVLEACIQIFITKYSI